MYSDTALIDLIIQSLTDYQERLIKRVATGRTQDQDIEPTLVLDIEELKALTGRKRGRQAFIEAFIEELESNDLTVERLKHNRFAITKPADNLPTYFESFGEFSEWLSDLEILDDEAA